MLLCWSGPAFGAEARQTGGFAPETAWLWTLSLLSVGLLFCSVYFFFKMAAAERERVRLRNVIWRAPFACLVVARDNLSIVLANNRALEVLQLPLEYADKRLSDFVDPTVIQSVFQEIRELGEFLNRELRMKTADGRELWVLVSATEMQRYGRRVLFVNFSDVTEQKRVSEELQHTNARFEALLKASPDGIMTISLEGVVRFANERALQLGRFSGFEQLVGKSLKEFLPGAEWLFFQDGLAKLASGEDGGLATVSKLLRADGSFIWIEPRSVVVADPFSGDRQVLIIVRDITERKETEERISEHAKRLEEALGKIAKLQNDMISICAWTKQVYVEGEWLPVDVYLSRHLGLKVSHGISGEGLKILEKSGGTVPPLLDGTQQKNA